MFYILFTDFKYESEIMYIISHSVKNKNQRVRWDV